MKCSLRASSVIDEIQAALLNTAVVIMLLAFTLVWFALRPAGSIEHVSSDKKVFSLQNRSQSINPHTWSRISLDAHGTMSHVLAYTGIPHTGSSTQSVEDLPELFHPVLSDTVVSPFRAHHHVVVIIYLNNPMSSNGTRYTTQRQTDRFSPAVHTFECTTPDLVGNKVEQIRPLRNLDKCGSEKYNTARKVL